MSYKILISPAKNLRKHVFNDHDRLSVPQFLAEAKLVHRSLAKCTHEELVDLMSISAKLASESKQMIKLWDHNFLYRSVEMFDGEVYRGLGIDTLADEFNDVLSDRLRILSGLYGILKPFDLIYPYRLEMGTKFSPKEDQKNLYDFWGEKVTKTLKKELEKDEVIINLASTEYFKVIRQNLLKNRIVTPIFKEFKNGQFTTVMMYAKHARGAMTRYLIENELSDIEELKLYDVDGYQYNELQSTKDEWVFIR